MNKSIIFLLSLTLFSCTSNETNKSEEEKTPSHKLIKECFKDKFEEQNLDYEEEMQVAIGKLQKIGLNVESGTTQEVVEIITQMKSEMVSYDQPLYVEEVIYKKHRGLIQECTKQHIYNISNGPEIMHILESIVLYELDSKDKFEKEINNAIDLIASLPETPEWLRPFNIYVIAAFYEQYYRLIKETKLQEKIDKSEIMEDYPEPPPPPPAPPAPPEAIEIEVE